MENVTAFSATLFQTVNKVTNITLNVIIYAINRITIIMSL
jgi:hypothetical protein